MKRYLYTNIHGVWITTENWEGVAIACAATRRSESFARSLGPSGTFHLIALFLLAVSLTPIVLFLHQRGSFFLV
jgi:hypothetical protein